MFDKVPENNTKRNQLHFLLNQPWDADIYAKLCMNNWLFKLSYKTPWMCKISGKETFYGKLIATGSEKLR